MKPSRLTPQRDLSDAYNDMMSLFGYMTTCSRYLKIIGKVGVNEKQYWIVKHSSHTAYVDRMVGRKTCGTWYGLWDGCKVDSGVTTNSMNVWVEGKKGWRLYRYVAFLKTKLKDL